MHIFYVRGGRELPGLLFLMSLGWSPGAGNSQRSGLTFESMKRRAVRMWPANICTDHKNQTEAFQVLWENRLKVTSKVLFIMNQSAKHEYLAGCCVNAVLLTGQNKANQSYFY